MLLWANTQSDLRMWVKSFTNLMLATDSTVIENFKVQKTKKNKLVVGLYECLKVSEDLVDPKLNIFNKRAQTIIPGSRTKAKKALAGESQEATLKSVLTPGEKMNADRSPMNLGNMKNELFVAAGDTASSPRLK